MTNRLRYLRFEPPLAQSIVGRVYGPDLGGGYLKAVEQSTTGGVTTVGYAPATIDEALEAQARQELRS